jgi:hypothetical protein
MLTRVEGGELHITHVHNFSTHETASTCTEFYVHVMSHLIFEVKLFRNLTKVFLSGDHGPHFTSLFCHWFEYTLYDRTGIVFACFFLCSYHAYNLCDGSGATAKVAMHRHAIEGHFLRVAHELAAMVNTGGVSQLGSDKDFVAYSYGYIPTSKELCPKYDFPSQKNQTGAKSRSDTSGNYTHVWCLFSCWCLYALIHFVV